MYNKLDALILHSIIVCEDIKSCFLSNIQYDGLVSNEAKRLANLTNRLTFRVIDARLQSLRKQGIITFNSKEGWKRA